MSEATRHPGRRARIAALAGMLLGLALLVSLGLNLALWDAARGYYADLQDLRLQPLEEDRVDPSQRLPAAPGRRLWVFHGDSRAADWPAPVLEGHEFRNLGVGGQTSTQVLQRVPSQLLPLKPDVVLLQVGINDLKVIGLSPERRASIVADVLRNIDRITQAARAGGATVVLTTVFPRSARLDLARRPFWSAAVDEAVDEVNRQLLAREAPGVVVFDAAAALRDAQGQVRAEWARDLLHLQPEGYRHLNQALLPRVAAAAGR